MLKLCARYQGLELGDEFAEVRRMCAGVRKESRTHGKQKGNKNE